MTARQALEGLLIELSKVGAPSLLLSEFNYYMNKGILQYSNKLYNLYDVNQQTTDNLRVLKATAELNPEEITNGYKGYYVVLPDDYVHLLNCVCEYDVHENFKCYNKGYPVRFKATRLTGDSWSNVLNDYYNRPTYDNPYYYINNVNQQNNLPTNKYDDSKPGSTDIVETGTEETNNGYTKVIEFPRTTLVNGIETTVVEKPAGLRHANTSQVRCEIRYGEDHSLFELKKVYIDYLKAPQVIRLTLLQLDLTKDTSQILEFPEYVCNEIINEIVMLVMEKTADPRLPSHVQVTLSIANPVQQTSPETKTK